MDEFANAQRAAREYSRKIENNDVISIVQIGSSLRKDDFASDSDLDFLVIYKKPVKDFLKHDRFRHFEIQIVQHGKNQFIKSLKERNPVEVTR